MRHCAGLALALATTLSASTAAYAEVAVDIVYLERAVAPPPTLSNLDPAPADLGVAGAVGITDNATTGQFLGHVYALAETVVAPDDDWLAAGRAAILSKIEKPAAVKCFDEILAVSDGIMVARGDLGVELPVQNVPPILANALEGA